MKIKSIPIKLRWPRNGDKLLAPVKNLPAGNGKLVSIAAVVEPTCQRRWLPSPPTLRVVGGILNFSFSIKIFYLWEILIFSNAHLVLRVNRYLGILWMKTIIVSVCLEICLFVLTNTNKLYRTLLENGSYSRMKTKSSMYLFFLLPPSYAPYHHNHHYHMDSTPIYKFPLPSL